ncbi:hypothetical protein [Acidaminobacter sp.]|uniref:hypothetical protein n=1 Tax=Acidaminobacter sp. TaxID=1872102 RepID=UPI00137E56DB|nr:hypothetical protein [Acidaminobacter sp.]MDK9711129.1 hypothetical protein [Acidaminobacter sp.]MZQ97391.1 hypothetical protein [Acidaminobacter sp.]
MKRLIAMFLSTVLIMMMSAFAFAYVDEGEYKVVIETPDEELKLLNEDDEFFVTGYIMANDEDIIEWIKLTINDVELEIESDDSDFDDVIGEWEDEKFAFKFVVSPDDFNIEDNDDDDYNIEVSTRIEPDDQDLGYQTEYDIKSVEFKFDYETDYDLQLTKPNKDIVVDNWSDDTLIKGWVQADEGDVLEFLRIEIDGDGAPQYITLIDQPSEYVMLSNDKFNFEAEWNLSVEDEFVITVFAWINPDEDGDGDDVLKFEDEITVEVIYDEDENGDNGDNDDKDMDNYPAAPAVANKILKELGISNRYMGTNLISEVSKLMGPNTEFNGVLKTDADDYEDEIRDFLNDRIDELEDMEAPPAPGNSANKGNGKNKGN